MKKKQKKCYYCNENTDYEITMVDEKLYHYACYREIAQELCEGVFTTEQVNRIKPVKPQTI